MLKTIEKIISTIFPPFPEVATVELQSEEEVEQSKSIHFDPELRAVSAFNYSSPIARSLIWALKYRNSITAAKKAAAVLYPFIIKLILFYSDSEESKNAAYFFLVPIPLHKKKARERGFSQTKLITDALLMLDTGSRFKDGSHLLAKPLRTKSQNKLKNRSERLANLAGAFSVPRPDLIAGAGIILIDDVITTGSTIRAAREAFLPHKPALVLAASVAWQGLRK